jgi:ABC-type glycerol-3-phosphate transport system permease component
MVIWKTAGFNMVLLLVGLQSIPRELIEAARIDGAMPLQGFRHVTLPQMKRTILLALSLSVIGSLLVFVLAVGAAVRPAARQARDMNMRWLSDPRLAAAAYCALCVALAIVFLFPIVWAALSSLKTSVEAMRAPPTWLPSRMATLVPYGCARLRICEFPRLDPQQWGGCDF